MGLHEEAIELRDNMCKLAPEIYKRELGNNSWEVAILSSQAYWEATKNEDSERGRFNARLNKKAICEEYLKGRSILYLSLDFNVPVVAICAALRSGNIFFTYDPRCSLRQLNRMFPDRKLPLALCTAYNIDVVEADIPEAPKVLTSRPFTSEIHVLMELSKYYTIEEVAELANRTLDMVGFIVRWPHQEKKPSTLEVAGDISFDEARKAVIDLYKENRSPLYISAYLNRPLEFVESSIIAANLPYCLGLTKYNMYCFMKILEDKPDLMLEYPLPDLIDSQVRSVIMDTMGDKTKVQCPKPISNSPDATEIACIKDIMRTYLEYMDPKTIACLTGRTITSAKSIVNSINQGQL